MPPFSSFFRPEYTSAILLPLKSCTEISAIYRVNPAYRSGSF
jgi:hypothetical protein